MHLQKKYTLYILLGLLVLPVIDSMAQVGNWEETHRGAVYFSVGYDKQWYKAGSAHIKQGVQNDYTLSGFTGIDQGPNNDIFSPSHYTYRLGCYLNYSQNAGLELSLSPIRFYMPDNQTLQVTGTYMGLKVTDMVEFERAKNFRYYLDNGSGSVGLNFVKRFGLWRKVSHKFSLDFVAKGGIALLTPRATYGFGTPAYAVGANTSCLGYNFEGGLKWTTHRHVFVEFDYHYQMADLNDIAIQSGTVSQQLRTQTITLNLGYIFPVSRLNPMFSKGWPHRKEINHPRPMYRREEDY